MSQYVLGIKYDMEVELSELIAKGQDGVALVNDQVFVDSLGVSYVDSGALEVVITNRRRNTSQTHNIRSDFGIPLGLPPVGTQLPITRVLRETGRRQVYPRGRATDYALTLKNTSALQSRIAAVSQSGTIINKRGDR